MIAVTGHSGCGKSSFLKAGVLPRLRKEAARWLVAPAFRPGTGPFAQLSRSLAAAAARDGQPFNAAAIEKGVSSAGSLVSLAVALTSNGGQADVRRVLVLAIDQLEELLLSGPTADGSRFLGILLRALSVPGAPLLVLATLRTDSLSEIEQNAIVREGPFEIAPLRAMRQSALAEAIEGPALWLGIELAPGLVTEIVDDCASSDSLPLLAMTLREMYHRDPVRFRRETYRTEIGGIEGSVALIVQEVTKRSGNSSEPNLLREAMLHLVDVNEAGAFLRRPGRRDRFPAAAGAALQRLVEARLLKSGEAEGTPILEVTHEALFRVWRDLRDWLEADRPFLLWRRRVSDARQEWERQGSDPDALLRGRLLADADAWLTRYLSAVDPIDRAYVESSRKHRREEVREGHRSRLLQRGIVGLGAGLLSLVLKFFPWESSISVVAFVAIGLISGKMLGMSRRGVLGFGVGYLILSIPSLLAIKLPDVLFTIFGHSVSTWELLTFAAFLLCGLLIGEIGAQGLTRASVISYGLGGLTAASYIFHFGSFVALPLFGFLSEWQLQRLSPETPQIRASRARRSLVAMLVCGVALLILGIVLWMCSSEAAELP